MKDFRKPFRNFSIQKKLILSFLFICSISALFLFFITIPNIANNSEKNTLYSAKQALEQTQEYISYRMEALRQTSYSIAYDSTLIDLISKSSDTTPISEQIVDKNTIDKYWAKSLISHAQTLSGVRFYVNDEFVYASSASQACLPYSLMLEKDWYQTMCNNNRAYYYIPPIWNESSKSISIVHLISNPKDYSQYIGAVVLDTPVSDMKSILQKCTVTANSYAYLINDEGVEVCTSGGMDLQVDLQVLQTANKQGGVYSDDDNLYSVCRIETCGWTLVQVIPVHDIWDIRFSSLQFVVPVCLIVILFSVFFSLRISKGITKRINLLSTAMKTFRYEINAPSIQVVSDGDEIDYLLDSYNQLTSRLNHLTTEMIQKSQQLNETELALLHSQIKPHFLFNTLDMIRYLADTGQTKKASAAIRALSEFYRSGLGDHTIWSTVNMELEHIRSYMEIQKMRFGEKVRLEIQIAPELLDINLPRITLQPIVENALLHGIQGREDKAGVITISAQISEMDMGEEELRLSIRDNGCGMSQDTIVTLFASGRFGKGIGLCNTNDRIRMHYGTDYGLSIQSIQNEYTEILIRVPVLRGKEFAHDNIDCG